MKSLHPFLIIKSDKESLQIMKPENLTKFPLQKPQQILFQKMQQDNAIWQGTVFEVPITKSL